MLVAEEIYVDPVTGKQIPMKDGKPCRVCVDSQTFKSWSKLGKKNKTSTGSTTVTDTTSATTDTKDTTKAVKKDSEESIQAVDANTGSEEWKEKNCPADVETLGRHTWTLLHTMAAYYPEKPAPSQKESMKTFFESFSQHYPCWFCKNDFQKDVQENPIDVTSRETLSEWLCRRHNKVNEKLGKKQFDCTKVFERWLTGSPNGECD